MAGRGTLILTGLAACVALIDPAALYAARHAGAGAHGFFSTAALVKAEWLLPPLALALTILGMLFRREPARKISAIYQYGLGVCGFLFACVAFAGAVTLGLAFLIGRAKPKLFDAIGAVHFAPLSGGDYTSFPSAPAACAMALGAALMALFPNRRIVFLGLALFAIAARFMLAQNYLTDVIAGALLGWLIAAAVRRWFEARSIVFAGERVKGGELASWMWNKAGAKLWS
jgi:undecaprenyl-diphosphatase